jgi:hypothetical protein
MQWETHLGGQELAAVRIARCRLHSRLIASRATSSASGEACGWRAIPSATILRARADTQQGPREVPYSLFTTPLLL